MMTGPPAPDDLLLGNGQPKSESGADHPGDDRLGAQRARLAGFWALVLRRFRDYAERSSYLAASRDRNELGVRRTDDPGR